MEGAKKTTELKKGTWTPDEDEKMISFLQEHGHGNWRTFPSKAGLQRCGKSCRLRWINYLRPDIIRGEFSRHEEKTIIRLHALLGNSWSTIAAHLPMRTDNEIKNYWKTRLTKRLIRMGIDPVTHKPKSNPVGSSRAADLSHMVQWESARLEAEARLAHMSKLRVLRNYKQPPPSQAPRLPAPPCLAPTSIPSCFSKSLPASLVPSPNSYLNFSCNTLTFPRFNPIVSNENACRVDTYAEAVHDEHVVYPTSNNYELASFNHESDGYKVGGPLVGELDDNKIDWNYLLNLVSSPMMEMESPLSGVN